VSRVVIDGGPLTPEQVVAVAFRESGVALDPGVPDRMAPARELVERVLESDRAVYGINTGLGALASTRVDRRQVEELQLNLLRSHAAGVGPPLPDEIVRAMLLLRARTLSQGHSGVRPVIVERLLDLLGEDLLPDVPSFGSVGASGDLAPFAHLALPLVGEGRLRVDGVPRPAADVLEERGIEPLQLLAKEGLSLLNGTEGMLAMACIALVRAERLADAADAAAAMSVEALMGSSRPFRPAIHELRPHPGQRISAQRIGALLEGSEIGASHADDFSHAVQDAYSLRCAPQVHGAVRDAIAHVRGVLEVELGSVVDNPIVFPDTGEILSAGNFHGQPLAIACDHLAVALTELGSISERRTDRILDPERSSGLTAFLSPNPGLHSGYMLAQYTAASLVAEARVLSHPASVESIPTSGSQEDHVSMGWGAARKALDVADRTLRVLAVEVMCAAQGIEQRRPLAPAPGTAALVAAVRALVPSLDADRVISEDIEAIAVLIDSGGL
jgi:histidine ammonia-lyase